VQKLVVPGKVAQPGPLSASPLVGAGCGKTSHERRSRMTAFPIPRIFMRGMSWFAHKNWARGFHRRCPRVSGSDSPAVISRTIANDCDSTPETGATTIHSRWYAERFWRHFSARSNSRTGEIAGDRGPMDEPGGRAGFAKKQVSREEKMGDQCGPPGLFAGARAYAAGYSCPTKGLPGPM